jgi:hypothetical protein
MNSTPRNARLVIASAAVAGLSTLVAACGSGTASSSSASSPATSATSISSATSSSSAAASAPGSGTSVTPSATTTAVAAATATSAATGGGTGGGTPCATSSLAVRLGTSQGTVGSTYVELDFTNISGAACTLYGYPGVSFTSTTDGATQIGAAATEISSRARQLVTLAPKAVAGAVLRVVFAGNFPASACHSVTAHYLRVYPPNELTPLYVGYTSPTCSTSTQVLSVSVVQPGAGDAS